jgi:protocatechuate 3,4-dioxygenase beta subunit
MPRSVLAPFVLALVVALALAAPAAVRGQTVLVRVVEGESMAPSFGALAYLVDSEGGMVRNTLTDERGRALFVGIPSGTYRVRVEMIGMATAETGLFEISEGTTITEELRMESSAIQLEGLEVELEAGRCSVRPGGEGLLVAEVWDEARKALSAASFTDQRGSYRYETVRYDRSLDRDGVILNEDQQKREGYMSTPFESRPAEDLAENGFVQRDGRDFVYYAPDAAVLLSDAFLDTHCFRMAGRREGGLVGLGFEPTGERKSVPDIAGTLWLDSETAQLRWLEFEYQYLDPEMTSPEVGGRVDFERMPDGTWIVPEWWIRMPVMATQTNFQGERRPYIARFHQTGGLVLEAREAGGRSLGQRAQTGGVEGVVMDSIGVPLAGVRVGVVGSNQEFFTDGEGKFSITGLTEGRYQVRFVDARLEQAGYIPEPVPRDVIRGELGYMEYHMPSMGDVLFEACRGVERPEGSVVLAGTVVNERGRAVPDVTVRVSWTGFYQAGGGWVDTENPNGLTQTTDGFETSTSSTGFFHFCGVPAGTALKLYAASGEVESDEYTVEISEFDTGALRVVELPQR